MNVPIWVVWKDLIFIVYWPIWVVPLYIWIRKKKLKNKWIFLTISMLLCISLIHLLEFLFYEVIFRNGGVKMEKFVSDNFGIIDSIIILVQFLIPMSLMHLSSKTKYFNRTSAFSRAQGASAH